MLALLIEPDGAVTDLDMPETGYGSELDKHLGGDWDYMIRPDAAVYTSLHRMGLPENPKATAALAELIGHPVAPVRGPVVFGGLPDLCGYDTELSADVAQRLRRAAA